MHHFYYSFLHWGIFASLGKLYLYRCTHSWISAPVFFWISVQHVASQCVKSKQGTRSMEGKTCLTLVLLLQKRTQNFPDPWDQPYFLWLPQKFNTKGNNLLEERSWQGEHSVSSCWSQRDWLSLCKRLRARPQCWSVPWDTFTMDFRVIRFQTSDEKFYL